MKEAVDFWHILAYGAAAFLVIRGFLRGFSGEVGGLAGLAAAAGTWAFGMAPAERAVAATGGFAGSPQAGRLAAFVLVLAGCIAVWLLLGRLLKTALQTTIRQPADAILGGGIGAAKAWLVILAVRHTLRLL
jgi:uncharacterized membrane protein required for colicin V production